MLKPLILVTGKDGQLGYELQQLSQTYTHKFRFLFTSRTDLDLTNAAEIKNFIQHHQPNYLINCAAYTAVDKAETEKELAYTINAVAPQAMAKTCEKIGCQFIHISTDYVFDGTKQKPYLPADTINPLNIYGLSKVEGEKLVLQANPLSIVVRTSWVYSTHGKNFVKTMLSLMNTRNEINVVDDQIGCPTYAADLAAALLQVVGKLNLEKNLAHQSIYHYSNSGNISWFQFAQAIQQISGKNCVVNPIASAMYPTPAKRSNYSVMDTTNIEKDFDVEIKDWKMSLQKALDILVNS